ncbi:MAG: DUF2057 domain-containing protein [Candidatus Thiodiazotropha sp. (ex Lucinoma borealis)]|nr:DUF2057 domain-containing protein [Candidatus Thiodiazotropha sp. (ex Troendleina suluensis)]MCU7862449.1 DUF2057 domain-containing protein [Candidatus Thiodiazotropha sp. (ex Lucinoma borealis)]
MKKCILMLLLGLFVVPIHAAKLIIPDAFEFLAVDGKDIEHSLLAHTNTVMLNGGAHKIALYYKDVVMDYDLGYEGVVKSKPFIVTLIAQPGVTYRLQPDEIAYQDKQAYARSPVINIQSDKTRVKVESGIERLVQQPSRWANETVLTKKPEERQSTTMTGLSHQHNLDESGEKLKYWWLQADKKTRQDFMSWVIGN